VVMCAPSGITEVENRALEEACLSAGARRVYLIEEPIAAAIGAGLPIAEPTGSIVVDVGGGTSEVAVISLGGIVVSRSLRVGGYDFDEAIMRYARRYHGLAIGQQTAESLKWEIGTAMPVDEGELAEIRGRDLTSGLPKTLQLTTEQVREAIAEPLDAILAVTKEALEETPPELAADIADRGILLAGGGSLLRYFEERFRKETGMPAQLADSPLTCVAEGAGRSLEELETLQRAGMRTKRRRIGSRRPAMTRPPS
jgi:rod shape-determining protein MreB and related proteins